jgi:hypothetical protein
MAYVKAVVLSRNDIQCGESITVSVTASFDSGSSERRISIRIPEGAQCFFITAAGPVLKLSKSADQQEVTVTFRPVLTCKRKGRTTFLLHAQASEPGSTHEVERQMSVTC